MRLERHGVIHQMMAIATAITASTTAAIQYPVFMGAAPPLGARPG
jgi:hypothetical protein